MSIYDEFEKASKQSNKSKYWNPSEMEQGENKFRAVMPPIMGFIEWYDGKPIRYRLSDKPSKPKDPEGKIKRFWSIYVWDYARKDLFILQIQQSGILDFLTAMGQDSEWGAIEGYDIKINKTGKDLQTKYAVSTVPHRELSSEIKQAVKNNPVNLEVLYDGGDPWKDMGSSSYKSSYEMPKAYVVEESDDEEKLYSELQMSLIEDDISTDNLDAYIERLCDKSNSTREAMLRSILLPGRMPSFKDTYCNYQKIAV